jgi:branched-chain amino acid transport system ATP-binding protein
MLQVEGLSVHFESAHVLQALNLAIGERPLALVGRNGMGKTTLCQTIMGMIEPSSGSIRFGGDELVGRRPHQVAQRGLALVPQGRRVFPSLTVDEHLRLVARKGRPAWTVERVYEVFPRLAERRRNGGAQLSGGEQQMLAIGRALLLNPALVIMDEPSEGLAPVIVDHLIEVLKSLVREGMGLLIVEQNLRVATAVADSVAIMVAGRIATVMPSDQLADDPAAQRRYLGVATNLH